MIFRVSVQDWDLANCDFYLFRSLAELSIVINWFQVELDCLTDVFHGFFSRVAFADTTRERGGQLR